MIFLLSPRRYPVFFLLGIPLNSTPHLGLLRWGFVAGRRLCVGRLEGARKRIKENIEQKVETEQDSTDVGSARGLLTRNHSFLNN